MVRMPATMYVALATGTRGLGHGVACVTCPSELKSITLSLDTVSRSVQQPTCHKTWVTLLAQINWLPTAVFWYHPRIAHLSVSALVSQLTTRTPPLTAAPFSSGDAEFHRASRASPHNDTAIIHICWLWHHGRESVGADDRLWGLFFSFFIPARCGCMHRHGEHSHGGF